MIDLLIRVTLILTVAFALNGVFRRTSAAVLHLFWLAAIVCVLTLPWLQVPKRAQVNATFVISSPLAVSAPIQVTSMPQNKAPVKLPMILAAIWACGAILMLVRLSVGLLRVRRITRRALPATGDLVGARVPVYWSGAVSVPMTWGFLRPVILIPETASGWPEERRRNAIAHEQAHIERWDWLAQMVGEAACVLYWFHPLMWLAARALHINGERACDDRVLLLGVPATGYASDLVEIARLARAVPRGALAMAEGNLETRVRAVLDDQRSRQAPGRLVSAMLAMAVVAAISPVAVLHLAAQPSGGRLAGSVRDVSGAMIPGVNLGAENLDGDNQEATVTDEEGRFQFTGLPAGRYRITIEGRGFKPFHSDPVMVGGGEAHLDAKLDLGGVFERVQVIGQRAAG